MKAFPTEALTHTHLSATLNVVTKNNITYDQIEEIEITTDIKYVPVLVNLEKAIENGLSQRLELSQRQIDLNNAEFDLIETMTTNEFRGDLNLSLGIMGNDDSIVKILHQLRCLDSSIIKKRYG